MTRRGAGRRLPFGQGAANLRFIIVLLLATAAILAALYVYGQMIEPEQEMIEQEAINAAS
jgi:hypothetical protein